MPAPKRIGFAAIAEPKNSTNLCRIYPFSAQSTTPDDAAMRHPAAATDNTQDLFSAEFKGTPPTKPRNIEVRAREYLTEPEVTALIKAIRKASRYPDRDGALILTMYEHGLRVSEAVELRWSQVDLKHGKLTVRRSKGGTGGVHPINGRGLRALRALARTNTTGSSFVFTTERGGPMATRNAHRVIQRAGHLAGLGDAVHPHQLRHAAGYRLINNDVDVRTVQAYLGHRSLSSTARYTALNSKKFEGLW